jgi:hypothetical protein
MFEIRRRAQVNSSGAQFHCRVLFGKKSQSSTTLNAEKHSYGLLEDKGRRRAAPLPIVQGMRIAFHGRAKTDPGRVPNGS